MPGALVFARLCCLLICISVIYFTVIVCALFRYCLDVCGLTELLLGLFIWLLVIVALCCVGCLFVPSFAIFLVTWVCGLCLLWCLILLLVGFVLWLLFVLLCDLLCDGFRAISFRYCCDELLWVFILFCWFVCMGVTCYRFDWLICVWYGGFACFTRWYNCLYFLTVLVILDGYYTCTWLIIWVIVVVLIVLDCWFNCCVICFPLYCDFVFVWLVFRIWLVLLVGGCCNVGLFVFTLLNCFLGLHLLFACCEFLWGC